MCVRRETSCESVYLDVNHPLLRVPAPAKEADYLDISEMRVLSVWWFVSWSVGCVGWSFCCLLFAVCCLLSAVCCLLFAVVVVVVCCSLFVVCVESVCVHTLE